VMLAAPASAEPPPAPSAARPAAPDDQSQRLARAQKLDDEALDLYGRGEYRAAIAKLEIAVELDPQGAELFYSLALIHERLGEIEIAERYYRKDLALETDPKRREGVQIILKRLSGAKKELVPKAAPSASPPPGPPITRRRIGPRVLIAGSVAAASLSIGVGFGISALVLNPGKDAKTRPGMSALDLQDDARKAHERAIIADVAFGLGAAAALTALLFYLELPPPGTPPRTASERWVKFDLAAGHASLQGIF
jgi:tetratricopeptide (TPR) repeat protein